MLLTIEELLDRVFTPLGEIVVVIVVAVAVVPVIGVEQVIEFEIDANGDEARDEDKEEDAG